MVSCKKDVRLEVIGWYPLQEIAAVEAHYIHKLRGLGYSLLNKAHNW